MKRPNLLAGESLPPAPRQQRSIAKRARLQNAALALFGEKGYESTSIEEITLRAKLALGTFYQHYRSKRQLLLFLMDDLLEKLSLLKLQPQDSSNMRAALRGMLTRAFAADLHYLGAYRAWQEAILCDASLWQKDAAIHGWSVARVRELFERLQRHPQARRNSDIAGMAIAMDSFFWSLLAQAVRMPRPRLEQQIDVATHLIYHALFHDAAAN